MLQIFLQALAVVWIGSVLPGCTEPMIHSDADDSELHEDSGIGGVQSYESIIDGIRRVAAQYPLLAELVQYGTSREGRPLTLIKLASKSSGLGTKRPAVLISEGIHGNEYLNISDRLPASFLNDSAQDSNFQKFLQAGGIVYIVPVLNPDGYSKRQRENARGQDLNRDFPIKAANKQGFTQPETKAIGDFIATESKTQNVSLEVSMEYHCCIGGLIHPWSYTRNPLPAEALAKHRDVGQKIRQLFGYRFGTVREIVGYEAVGGSDDYYYENYGRLAFSFEGARGREDENLSKHVQFWQDMFERVKREFSASNATDSSTIEIPLFIKHSGTAEKGTFLGSAPANYQKMSLCFDSVTLCAAGRGNVFQGEFSYRVGERNIFRFDKDTSISSNTELQIVLIATEANGLKPAIRSVRVIGK